MYKKGTETLSLIKGEKFQYEKGSDKVIQYHLNCLRDSYRKYSKGLLEQLEIKNRIRIPR